MPAFPDDFLWGAATAGHQVEGGNTNSDCWVMEHVPFGLIEVDKRTFARTPRPLARWLGEVARANGLVTSR